MPPPALLALVAAAAALVPAGASEDPCGLIFDQEHGWTRAFWASGETQEGCAECPLGTVPDTGGGSCHFSPLPLFGWLLLNLTGSLILAAKDGTLPGEDNRWLHNLWFALMLPAHLALRPLVLARALLSSAGQDAPPPPAAKPKGEERYPPWLVRAGMAAGVLFELVSVLLFVGAWPQPEGQVEVYMAVCSVVWLLACACNPFFATWPALFGYGVEWETLEWAAPCALSGRWHLVFNHYFLGVHPRPEDLHRYDAREERDVSVQVGLYWLSLSFLQKSDAVEVLRRAMASVQPGADIEEFLDPLEPLTGLLGGAGEALSWSREWRPTILAFGGGVVQWLADYNVEPAAPSVEDAIREAAMAKVSEEDGLTLPAAEIEGMLEHCLGGREELKALEQKLTWKGAWGPPVVREDAAFLDLLARYGIRPSRKAVEAAIRYYNDGRVANQASLETLLAAIPLEEPPSPKTRSSLAATSDAPKILAGLSADLGWEGGWRRIVMSGGASSSCHIVRLLTQLGAPPTRKIVEAAIRAQAMPEVLELLLKSANAAGEIKDLDKDLAWEDVWRPRVRSGDPREVQVLCHNGIQPTHAIVEAGILERPKDESLQALLEAADPPLRGISARLTWEGAWRPLAEEGAGDRAVEILAGHHIVPTRQVVEAAILECAPSATLALILGAATKGGVNLGGLGPRLGWQVWRPAVMSSNAAWIKALRRCGLHPTREVAESAICAHAPAESLRCLLARANDQKVLGAAPGAKDGAAPLLDGSALTTEVWAAVAKRGGPEALPAAEAVVRGTPEAPPGRVIIDAIQDERDPQVVEVLAAAFAERTVPLELPRALWLRLVDSLGTSADGEPPLARLSSLADESPAEDGPGEYRSLVDTVVRAGPGMGSRWVANLDAGNVVAVVEVVPREKDKRLRARIESPQGWISLANMETGERLAERLAPPALLDAAPADPEAAAERRTARLEALLAAALRHCAAPDEGLTCELWERSVFRGAVRAVRLLRESGAAILETPREEGAEEEGGEPEEKACYTVLQDGTPVMVAVPRQFASVSAAPSTAPSSPRSQVPGTEDPSVPVALQNALDGEMTLRAAPTHLTCGGLLQVAARRTKEQAAGRSQEAMLRELVQCEAVRSHLDDWAQADYDLSEAMPEDPVGLTPRSKDLRARWVQGIAARLLGRASLRSLGIEPKAPAMPRARPLPALRELQRMGLPETEPVAVFLDAYGGAWVNARDGRSVCQISDGLLTWSPRFGFPQGSLRITAACQVEIDIAGTTYSGTLKGDTILWNDGDVWRRATSAEPGATEVDV